MLVNKVNGKWRVCVYFTNVNKVCPKDSYSLLRIDQLVDFTVGYELLTFIDAYSGYYQIFMAGKNKEKNNIYYQPGNPLLQRDAFQIKECESNFSAFSK